MNFPRVFAVQSIILTSFAIFSYAATPPGQPVSGPGGQEYYHASLTKREFGEGARRYWIYEPADPTPSSAPLVIFLHGWSAINPKVYGAWIEHIVRRGNIVVYPIYQDKIRTPAVDYLPNTISAFKDALIELSKSGHVHPILDKVAVVGHSMGGVISADVAAVTIKQGLPPLKAVMCVEPGGDRRNYHLQDLSQIPSQTLLLVVVGDADRLAKDISAKKIFKEAASLPASNKNYVIVRSDSHGTPPLKANHLSPLSPDEEFDSNESFFFNARFAKLWGTKSSLWPNALNYYGYWKLFDALCDAAFYGKNRDFALGNTPQQKYMGKWSDGVPVKELYVSY